MKDDVISRQVAIDALDNAAEQWNIAEPYHEGMRAGYRNSARLILSLPSAQQERKKGMWLDTEFIKLKECSCCGAQWGVYSIEEFDFCPSCGVEMEGVHDV